VKKVIDQDGLPDDSFDVNGGEKPAEKTIGSHFNIKRFRVTIFGSARIEENDPIYNEVVTLARLIAAENIDIVTGGGTGLMEAANKGHHEGRTNELTHSIGLNIKIPQEQKPNLHLDIKREFERFSKRLDTFMMLSDAVVVAPGGIGTLLEFAYTWQLVQVKHICRIPIILLGEMWLEFMKWIEAYPLACGFLSRKDVDPLLFAKDSHEAIVIIKRFHEGYLKGDDICLNFKKYKVDISKEWKGL
jgi:uncharacterized protein (TIGR00730 family)